MKRPFRIAAALFAIAFFSQPFFAATAAEETTPSPQIETSLTGEPLRYTYVSGDPHKFREQNWMTENYAGGVSDFTLEGKNLPENIFLSMDGHAIPDDNDYEAHVRTGKTDFGYADFEYQEFTKYYDDSGGVYYPFRDLNSPTLDRELALDIGHIRIETGLTLPDMPVFSVVYERHFKDGSKSRLTWAGVTQFGVTRNIAPSYQDLTEIVDTVELHQSHTIKGFELQGEQSWEWSHMDSMREERWLSITGTAADRKIRDQYQRPQAQIFSTTETIGRWYRDESVFTGLAYNFVNLNNNEVENIFEMDEFRALTNFGTNPKAIRNARADNEYDAHTWTGNLFFTPLNWMSITSNLRTEVTDRKGHSRYPSDTTPNNGGAPDTIINTTEVSETQDKVGSIGEGLSIRITKIPKTAIYNDFEFEQVRNWLSEDRDSLQGQSASNAGEIFGRETITYVSRGIWTIGGQFVPTHWATLTSHFRINRNNSDYDDKRETQPTATGAKSAFFDALNIQTEELATHLTLKPRPWLRPSVRYRYQIRAYEPRVEDQVSTDTHMETHIFTFDVSVQPLKKLLLIGGFSPQYAWIDNPLARTRPGDGGPPRYQANIFTWLFNLEYDITERLSFLSGLEYSHTNNYDDFTASGLPLGVGYNQINVTAGINWKISELLSASLDYALFHYAGDDRVDRSDYNANQIGIKTKVNWA